MEGMAGMAMAGIAADGWSVAGAAAFIAMWTVMMAAMMLPAAAPMIFMMPLTMGSMYSDRRLNRVVYIGSGLLFILAFGAIRDQTLVDDEQFVRSMIPHHSGAILMCERASIRDAEVRELCFKPNGIIESQSREIRQMERIKARL